MKKPLAKYQTKGQVKSAKSKKTSTGIDFQKVIKDWAKAEKKATNPKNKVDLKEIQRQWNKTEKKATSPKSKNKPKMVNF